MTRTTRARTLPVKLAGGHGTLAASQDPTALLRRAVMACLLWEDVAYESGESVAQRIRALVPQVPAEIVAQMAIEARYTQKLRHVPLLLVREMCRHENHKRLVADTLARIINRPDELAEFVSMYWATNDGKKSLPAQVKKGLARAFTKFDEYQLGKWNKDAEVKLRDVLFLCHAKPQGVNRKRTKHERLAGGEAHVLNDQELLWQRLVDGQLAVPDTWEVGLSAATSEAEKRAVWERLITERKLPAFALLKNLRNMQQVNVPLETIRQAFQQCKPDMLLPIDFLKAQKYAPTLSAEIEELMLRCARNWPKLPGLTVFVVDVSGSMGTPLSKKSEFTRMEAAIGMTILAAECCEECIIVATAGNDGSCVGAHARCRPLHGFALAEEIRRVAGQLGGGGIFTRQVCEWIRARIPETPDRIAIFSDSADCDHRNSALPAPNGRRNYIVDVSAEAHGVNYEGVWTAEISSWSEHFLRFIRELENDIIDGTGESSCAVASREASTTPPASTASDPS